MGKDWLMNQINLIFSTKFYPHCDQNGIVWDNIDLPKVDELSFIREMVPQNYRFDYIKKREIPNRNNTMSYIVYVVPCTEKTQLSIRMFYLNEVVKTIFPTVDTKTLKNTFLIAHDKDFDEKGDCIVLSTINGKEECFYLEKLLDLRHIFLFQHDGKLNQGLNRIQSTDEEALNFEACQFLHKIVDVKSRMIRFFNDINQKDSDNNNYPQSKQC